METIVIDKTILLKWIHLASLQNIDLGIVLDRIKIPEQETTVPFATYALLVTSILEQSKANNLGLKFGEQSNIAALGIVGQIIQSSRTLEEALHHACNYFNLISNAITLELTQHKNHVQLKFTPHQPTYKQYPKVLEQLIISSLYFSFKEICYLTFSKAKPLKLTLDFDPKNLEELNTIFECDIDIMASENAIYFHKDNLNQPILYADYKLMLHLEKLACKRITDQKLELQSYSNKVITLIYSLIDPYFPSIKSVANQLDTSERSLQRRLASEHTSYSHITNSIKKSMAKEYLQQNLSVKEISYLLGYSDASAFTHAFTRWYGTSPTDYKDYN
ncbi:AraC family transcriptional regulator ligand-binding domain-containing protein [Wenyingzhuangia sp. IMCC45574]